MPSIHVFPHHLARIEPELVTNECLLSDQMDRPWLGSEYYLLRAYEMVILKREREKKSCIWGQTSNSSCTDPTEAELSRPRKTQSITV